jgi:hypothetical protein
VGEANPPPFLFLPLFTNFVEVEFSEVRRTPVNYFLNSSACYTTAVASISTKSSGKAKRVIPSSVLAG